MAPFIHYSVVSFYEANKPYSFSFSKEENELILKIMHVFIGEITPKSTEADIRRKYETVKTEEGFVYDTMGIRVTASPAYGDFGFIAEVVTIPLSPGWKPDFGKFSNCVN